MKTYSPIEFIYKLRNTNWSAVTDCNDVNVAWSTFKDISINILNEIVPLKQIRIKTRTEPWMNSDILHCIKYRDKALNIANKNKGNRELRSKFNSLRNKVQREIK
ncbi:unnamed protein product [Meganyctiphanes norvegica]|uniref:Uncharacterized protein n=1 Tax=Meganyctiphanes norvegica TaxID=48144 RepID=A0AAV2R8K9_MEGNR